MTNSLLKPLKFAVPSLAENSKKIFPAHKNEKAFQPTANQKDWERVARYWFFHDEPHQIHTYLQILPVTRFRPQGLHLGKPTLAEASILQRYPARMWRKKTAPGFSTLRPSSFKCMQLLPFNAWRAARSAKTFLAKAQRQFPGTCPQCFVVPPCPVRWLHSWLPALQSPALLWHGNQKLLNWWGHESLKDDGCPTPALKVKTEI